MSNVPTRRPMRNRDRHALAYRYLRILPPVLLGLAAVIGAVGGLFR